jgi:Rrf2 family transcriptional regulator, nitric oxide-sensitive transcriptional repressor
MYLTRYTDYSLRVLIYLGLKQNQPATIREIANSYGISRNHLMKAVHQLGRRGYIRTARGKGGWISLARGPELINVGDVVRHMEERVDIVECFDPAKNHCRIAPVCILKRALHEALGSFLTTLDHYTLADILQSRKGLSALLGVS